MINRFRYGKGAALLLFFISLGAAAQHYVPIEPMNRNVIIEEFTGVRCPNCPSGHQVLSQILAANPGRAFAVAYHPFNSSYTQPYTGDPDFRRHYADSLYMTPYCGTSRYMPSAFVHRRMWSPPERLTERTNWASFSNIILAEPSPLNVGMATRYDLDTKLLHVVVDVYYTEGVTGTHNLMVTLAENDLQSQQSGATGTYTHKHTFRESFAGQWGDPLSGNAGAGTFFRKEYTFDNNTTGYDMYHCELLAFVLDNTSQEVVSGIGCQVWDTTWIIPDVNLSTDTLFFNTALQCTEGLTATIRNDMGDPILLTDVQPASLVPGPLNWVVDPWPFTSFPNILQPGDSVNLTVHVQLPLLEGSSGMTMDSLFIATDLFTHYLKIAVDNDLLTSIAPRTQNDIKPVLYGAFPNPVRESAMISFYLPRMGEVRMELVDLEGNIRKTLVSGLMQEGLHHIPMETGTCGNPEIHAGVYLIRMTVGDDRMVQRCIVIK